MTHNMKFYIQIAKSSKIFHVIENRHEYWKFSNYIMFKTQDGTYWMHRYDNAEVLATNYEWGKNSEGIQNLIAIIRARAIEV